MKISATVKNNFNRHEAVVATNGVSQEMPIPVKTTGYGSSVNGGELLLLALATCFCNDLYREANKRNIALEGVEVICTAEFGGEGEPGFNFQYKVNVTSDAPTAVIDELIAHTDHVAEIHNTLRKGVSIAMSS